MKHVIMIWVGAMLSGAFMSLIGAPLYLVFIFASVDTLIHSYIVHKLGILTW